MRRPRNGFTMIEAVVALAIVSVVCVGVLGAHGAGLRAQVTAEARLTLATLARERLAQVDLEPTPGRLPDSLAHGAFTGLHAGVLWDVELTPVIASPGLHEVVVVVRDASSSFTLRTRRYQPVSAR